MDRAKLSPKINLEISLSFWGLNVQNSTLMRIFQERNQISAVCPQTTIALAYHE